MTHEGQRFLQGTTSDLYVSTEPMSKMEASRESG